MLFDFARISPSGRYPINFGTLQIAQDETASEITVTATSELNKDITGAATVSISDKPGLSVAITPSNLVVEKGKTYRFEATMPDTDAVVSKKWEVTGGNSETTMTPDGTLTVSDDEDAVALKLTVTVTVNDTNVTDSSTINVPLSPSIVNVAFIGNEPKGNIPQNNGAGYFVGGRAQAIADVAEWAKYIKRQDAAVVLFGCVAKTDTPANEGRDGRIRLGQRRADALKEVLVTEYGIDPDMIITKGLGYDNPWHQDNGITNTFSWNEAVAAKNRIVAILPADDPYTQQILDGT